MTIKEYINLQQNFDKRMLTYMGRFAINRRKLLSKQKQKTKSLAPSTNQHRTI